MITFLITWLLKPARNHVKSRFFTTQRPERSQVQILLPRLFYFIEFPVLLKDRELFFVSPEFLKTAHVKHTIFWGKLQQRPLRFRFLCRCKKSGSIWTGPLSGEYRDSNPGPPEPQSGAITNFAIPTIFCFRSFQIRMSLKGFEPPTHGLEGRCSIQLSYGHVAPVISRKAGDGNRTHVSSLEG